MTTSPEDPDAYKPVPLSEAAKKILQSHSINADDLQRRSSVIKLLSDPSKAAYLISSSGTKIYISKPQFTIGRQETADFYLNATSVSRNHAVIERSGSRQFWLKDVGSSNGTYLNGERISEPKKLTGGDQIQFGDCLYAFHFSEIKLSN